jgi:phosphoenolpyruvate---glycerone phosphotransferase subunit DhaL
MSGPAPDGRAGAATIVSWLVEAQHAFQEKADELCALDAALGDGDHGTNMRRGFDAVGRGVTAEDAFASPGDVLLLAGRILLSTIGGASGALWGLALRRAGRALEHHDRLDTAALGEAVDAMMHAVVELGEASPGDKTMLDALLPAAQAIREAADRSAPLSDAAAAAAGAAHEGALATARMQARKGRASFIGARSIGHKDPSAASTALFFHALTRVVGPGTDQE